MDEPSRNLICRVESALEILHRLREQAGARPGGSRDDDESLAALADTLEDLRAAAQENETRLGLLEIIVATRDPEQALLAALHFLMERFDIEAAGLRLREGDDFPYFATRGFSKEFEIAESSLCQLDERGCPVHDSLGNPVLECMCGAVIQERVDPSKPFFTAGGSFWTNCTSELLATTSESERMVRTRDHCNREGYESVALLPLRVGDETFGLVQLNDSRQGRFSADGIALLEELVRLLARVLA